MRTLSLCFIALLGLAQALWGERINHEGRILGPLPVMTTPLLFNTPEADAVVSAMQIMPVTHPWNEDISQRPFLGGGNADLSTAMINRVKADLTVKQQEQGGSSRQTLRPFYEMNYILVPDNQATQSIEFFDYPDESDLDGGTDPFGLYPIPTNLPIEGWPLETGSQTLEQWQQSNAGGDRHSIMVKPGAGFIWETWQTKRVGSAWRASNGAKFNLNSNALRPSGWTSADAAGLAMFPAVVRYDECARGQVEHALRLIVPHTRYAFIYPATHRTSGWDVPDRPAMGQRFRLNPFFNAPANWTVHEKAVVYALKKYGAIVADNGGFFSVSVSPDSRFPGNAFSNLSSIDVNQFEVVQTTGATEGPRSPNAPSVNAGLNQAVRSGGTVTLAGQVTAPGGGATVQWMKYNGPGTVTFGNAAQAGTTAQFSAPGTYTLMLRVTDNVHTPVYDAVAVLNFQPEVLRNGNEATIRFPTATGVTYRVERTDNLTTGPWTTLADVVGTGNSVDVPHVGGFNLGKQFYRVRAVEN
jgi:hypothetical protein